MLAGGERAGEQKVNTTTQKCQAFLCVDAEWLTFVTAELLDFCFTFLGIHRL